MQSDPRNIQSVELVVAASQRISTPEIRERDAASPRSSYTQHFLAIEAGLEMGLLSIDFHPSSLFPPKHQFVVYELFVPTVKRRRGVGRRLLQAAEEMARNQGYKWVLLVPRSLDKMFSQTDLEAWYARNGYMPLESSANGAVVKNLDGIVPSNTKTEEKHPS